MIEEIATVVGTEGRFAWVNAARGTSCGTCSAQEGCGTAALSRVLGQRQAQVRALNSIGAKVGDEVIVGIEERALVQGSVAVYLVPLLGLLLGGGLGELVAGRMSPVYAEPAATVLGTLGLVAGLLWLRGFGRRIRKDLRYQPVVVRKLRH